MIMFEQQLTLMSEGQIWGNDQEAQLEVIKKYGSKAAITDLAILTGAYVCEDTTRNIKEDNSLSGRVGWQWTRSDDRYGDVLDVSCTGDKNIKFICYRAGVIRPVLQSSNIFSLIVPNRVRGYNETEEVEYGEYPQNAVEKNMQQQLGSEYISGNLCKTGRNYTFDSRKYDDYSNGFLGITYDEYEYAGKKYIRVQANSCYGGNEFQLSNEEKYKNGDYVWIEVQPVKWLIDDRTGLLISKKGLLSGIRFLERESKYNGDFDTTEMKMYLDEHMSKDLFQTASLNLSQKPKPQKIKNPYGFDFGQVSEEEIIKGAIESNVPVFLHGPSSEGKSARVKQIDPTCEIVYLRNATPESLNGKSVYNAETGEMIDIEPTWLKKLRTKCETEPDRLHILFFDEITNALPSIQGSAFNIVLDKEVNGTWKLPENARIVAAGNEMKDSLAANKLAEPLFNRFAHVYIKTTTESWLKWASENNIHPAIYCYIAYKNGTTLRSKYDGEKPNADPRKWEMASKMLYATKNPEMLRALVGEEITKEFVAFCKQQVITLEDVINRNYTKESLEQLNVAEKSATIIGLSAVGIEHLEEVRDFAYFLGKEFGATFDTLWTHGEEERLEIIAELKAKQKVKIKN